MSYSVKSRNRNDDDSSFSIESFQNRVTVARSIISGMSSSSTTRSMCADINKTRSTSPTTMTSGSMCIDINKTRSTSPTTITSDITIVDSTGNNQVASTPPSSSRRQSCDQNPNIPPEIALLHRETDLLLDSIRSDGEFTISPLKDDFHPEMHHSQKTYIDDDVLDNTSVSSFLSDDDGMQNEVKKLKFAIKAIRKDIAGVDLIVETNDSETSNIHESTVVLVSPTLKNIIDQKESKKLSLLLQIL